MNLDLHFYGDLPLWEKQGVLSLAQWLEGHCKVQIWENPKRGRLHRGRGESVWIVTRHWREALRRSRSLEAKRVLVSVMSLGTLHPSLPTLFLRRFQSALPKHIRLVSHCPLNERFFREIEEIPSDQVLRLPLPCAGPSPAVPIPDTVGVVGVLNRESNLNYAIGVAHYLHRVRPSVRMTILGVGPLVEHARKLASDLGLGEVVEVRETASDQSVGEFSVLLYAPLRNDHFNVVLGAAHARVPVVATELPGIEEYLMGGKGGHILPQNEIRPMGELLHHLLSEESARTALRDSFSEALRTKFSVETVGQQWVGPLLGVRGLIRTATAAA